MAIIRDIFNPVGYQGIFLNVHWSKYDTYSIILMGSSERRRKRSGSGYGMGGRSSPLVQVRIIRLVHHFRTTHYIHIHIANRSTISTSVGQKLLNVITDTIIIIIRNIVSLASVRGDY